MTGCVIISPLVTIFGTSHIDMIDDHGNSLPCLQMSIFTFKCLVHSGVTGITDQKESGKD